MSPLSNIIIQVILKIGSTTLSCNWYRDTNPFYGLGVEASYYGDIDRVLGFSTKVTLKAPVTTGRRNFQSLLFIFFIGK